MTDHCLKILTGNNIPISGVQGKFLGFHNNCNRVETDPFKKHLNSTGIYLLVEPFKAFQHHFTQDFLLFPLCCCTGPGRDRAVHYCTVLFEVGEKSLAFIYCFGDQDEYIAVRQPLVKGFNALIN